MSGYNPTQLAGFNPLKALGRALGSTGRAIVGAVVPGVGGALQTVLDTAAKGSATNAPVTTSTTSAAPATATSNTPAPTQQESLNTQVVDLVKTMIANQDKNTGSQPSVIVTPGGGGASPTYLPSPYGQPAQTALPNWVLPAAIGGAALLFITSQRRGR